MKATLSTVVAAEFLFVFPPEHYRIHYIDVVTFSLGEFDGKNPNIYRFKLDTRAHVRYSNVLLLLAIRHGPIESGTDRPIHHFGRRRQRLDEALPVPVARPHLAE